MKGLIAFAAACAAAGVLAVTGAPQAAQAAPLGPAAASPVAEQPMLVETAGWRGGRGHVRGHHARPGRFYRPGYHRGWRPYRPGYYRPAYYRPWRPAYFAPVYGGPRTVCRIRHRQVWTGWGYVWRPVRVCWRRW